MPIYAYRCAKCGFEKDVLQKLSDPILTECPSCHAQAFQKQVTAAGFQLKGSGWYATDFRNPPVAAKPAPDGGTDAAAAATPAAPAEGKSAAAGGTEGGSGAAEKAVAPASPSPSAAS